MQNGPTLMQVIVWTGVALLAIASLLLLVMMASTLFFAS